MRVFALAFAPIVCTLAARYDWSPVDRVLTRAIENGTFPGCSAAVTTPNGDVVLLKGFGSYVYAGQKTPVGHDNPAVTAEESLFDMASLTKILGATTVSAMLYQRGYPPDPVPGYSDPSFGCPAASLPAPPLTFNCSERIFASLLSQTLQYPTGTEWLYSDLSIITMQYALGTLIYTHQLVQPRYLRPDCAGASPSAQPGLLRSCHFEAFVRVHVFEALGMRATGFLPQRAAWPAALPTWNDSTYRHAALQGVVSDENSYALGGIAGHAGVFSTAADVVAGFARMWMYGPQAAAPPPPPSSSSGNGGAQEGAAAALPPPPVHLLNASTVATFTTVANASFSPRALGWLTQTPLDTYQGCGGLAPSTFYHTGYTGTLLCCDPTRNVTTVLLTNRVWPARGSVPEIQAARQAFNDAVLEVLAAGPA